MRGRSVALRLDRLADCGHAGDRERLIHAVAAESGLSPAEVRDEFDAIEEHHRRYGPSTLEQVVHQLADELGLPEADLWGTYDEIVATGDRP